MHDPRVTQLAEQLVGYSTALEAGEKILLDLSDVPDELGVELIRAVRRRGGVPFLRLHTGKLTREMAREASDEQFEAITRHLLVEMRDMDAYIAVRGSHNINESSDVSPEKNALVMRHLREVLDVRVKETKWCVLRWPHPAMAQLASMSTEAFEDFYFRVCLLDYEALLPTMQKLKERMDRAKEVHITGPGTDLRFSVEGLSAIVCGGGHNIPDGEVFTAPVRDSVQGRISYNAPTIYRGIGFDGVVLDFENGRIVRAEAAGGKSRQLNDILDTDEGARYVGEFALGFNPVIREPMRDILFDEKIAGSFHFTPGQAYEQADNGNRSAVHWDLVSIQRPEWGGGEIAFDGEVLRRDGLFLPEELSPLNGEPGEEGK